MGLKNIKILADNAVREISSAVVGANEKDLHLIGVIPEIDLRWTNMVISDRRRMAILVPGAMAR